MTQTVSRRDLLAGMGAAAIGFDTVAQARGSAAPAEAKGVVFLAEPDHLLRRPGAHGLGGVMVSNGRGVTLTNPDGSWKLPVLPGDSVFVIKPPHFKMPLTKGCIPQISYTAGRGESLPASIDFALIHEPEPDHFKALLLTDTQPDSDEELDFVRDDIIAGLLDRPAAFGIHHGDVVGDALHLYARHQELLSVTGIPWHHCAGNHDIDRSAVDDASSRETWKRAFGPRRYAFQHAQATFLILDNVEYLGRADGRYRGKLGREQLQFVRNVLAHVPKDSLVVLSMHIPLRCHLDPENPADTTTDYQDLLRLLQGRPHTVSFSGHLHATEHHYLSTPGAAERQCHHHHVLTAASGSWWSGPRDYRGIPCADSTDGTPNGFHILSVDGHRYRTEFVPAVGKRIARFRATVDACDDGKRQQLLVNVFDGGPRTRVICRFADHDWTELSGVSMRDPVICRLFQRDAPRKDWVQPTPSSHIWASPVPERIAAGAHRIEVRVHDEYGQVHEMPALVEVRRAARS